MITDSNQACLAKMTGRRLQEEELNRYAVDFSNFPFFAQLTYPST